VGGSRFAPQASSSPARDFQEWGRHSQDASSEEERLCEMIVHSKKKSLDKPGEVLKVRLRIVASEVRAEVILDDGRHEIKEVAPDEVVTVPIWSALDLVNRGKAVYA
jgi:hypothetical protein